MLLLQGSDLPLADPVLARAGPSSGERVLDDAPDELVGALELSPLGGIDVEADVDVAVACVPEIPAWKPSRSISARAKRTAPASSVTGTHTSVVRSAPGT